MKAALEKNGFKGCKDSDLEPMFTYLEFCLKQVSDELAIDTLNRSLRHLRCVRPRRHVVRNSERASFCRAENDVESCLWFGL